MRRFVGFCGIFLVTTLPAMCYPALAQDTTYNARLALARELVVTGNEQARLQAYAAKAAKQSADELEQFAKDAAGKDMPAPDLLTYIKYVEQELDLKIPDLMEAHAKFFAEHLTSEELENWKAFMRSSTGEKLVAVSLQLQDQSFAETQKWVNDATNSASSRMAVEMKKRDSK